MADKKGSRRWLWLLGGLVLLPVVAVFLVGLGLYDALHPDAPATDLKGRSTRTLHARTGAGPLPDRTGCGLIVQTVASSAPLGEVDVEMTPASARDGHWSIVETSSPTGIATFEDVPCGDVLIQGTHHTLAGPGPSPVRLNPGERLDIQLLFLPAVEVTGTVRDKDGRAVSDAIVRIQDGGETVVYADDAGRYSHIIRLPDLDRSFLSLSADALGYGRVYQRRWLVREGADLEPLEKDGVATVGYRDHLDAEPIEVAAGDRIEVDFELYDYREVRVWCAGLPDDLCNDMLVQCTHPLVPLGESCSTDDRTGETICDCEDQDGAVAIRGAGKSTLVQPGEDEAWLDFRDGGVIIGRVMVGGVPARQCEVATVRVPNGLEDLPRGVIAAQKAECDTDGRFEIQGLVDGDWELVVQTYTADMGEGLMRVVEPSRVRPRKTTDIGEVEMLAGGGIEGHVYDGVTGLPANDAPVLAIKRGQGNARSTPFVADINGDGSFVFEGLPPGEWELCYFLTPHVKTYVTVDDGAITDGVEVETSDATALETNGFSLGVEDGSLAVVDVEPGSLAEEAGLQTGDYVDGVLVGGLDIGSHLGEHADKFMQLVLGHWDGPGITLVVERDGEELEVELDW